MRADEAGAFTTPAPTTTAHPTAPVVARAARWPKPRPRFRWAGNPRFGAPSRDYSPAELVRARLDRLEATLAAHGIRPVDEL